MIHLHKHEPYQSINHIYNHNGIFVNINENNSYPDNKTLDNHKDSIYKANEYINSKRK